MKKNLFVLSAMAIVITAGSVPKANAMGLCLIPGYKGNAEYSHPSWDECVVGSGVGQFGFMMSVTTTPLLVLMSDDLAMNTAEARDMLAAQADSILKGVPVNPSENLVGALAQKHQASEEEMAQALRSLLDSEKAIDDQSIDEALAQRNSAKEVK